MKISEIPYKRPDADKISNELKELVKRFKNAQSGNEQLAILNELDEINKNMNTMGSLSYIRFSLNTNDEFYTKEKEFFDKFEPEVQLILQELAIAVLNSPYIDELKKVYPPVVFKNLELSVKSMNEEMVPMLVEESNLVTKYSQLINNVEIDFMGEKYNPATISKFFSNNDREIRKSAMFAFGNAMNKISTELDSYYDDLVKIRTKMGQTLGMETYTQLGYYRMSRNCYDKEDVAKFRANVKKYIVPLVSEIKEVLKKQFKWDKLMIYDNSVITKDEPKPIGTPEEIFANGSKMYNEMDSYIGSVFDRMVKDEAFDYMPRKGKWGGGYCTELADYKTPFILANFNGSSHDVEVLTHEFGHALAAENAFSLGFMQRQPTMESCEVHSMSMEFLTYPWMKLFFGNKVDNFEFYHMVSSLCFLPYGTIVDYFQQEVYDNPNMTPKERNDLWLSLDKEFLPHMSEEGVPFYEEGRRWQRQMHIYESPFYYIDYCFAQFTAFQFLALSKQDYKAAYEKYMKFLKAGGTKTYTDLLEYAGLKSPFDEASFVEVCNTIKSMLNIK